jgi:serine/threonine protein kinase
MPTTVALGASFDADYALGPEIGRGTYSVVRRCARRATGEVRAVKIIATRPFKLSLSHRGAAATAAMLDEVRILRALEHDGIIRVYEVYEGLHEGREAVFVVTELAPGGELFDSIIKAGNFSEPQARHVLWQALRTLGYMHDRGVVHRDLKPENLLVFSTVNVPAADPVVRPAAAPAEDAVIDAVIRFAVVLWGMSTP